MPQLLDNRVVGGSLADVLTRLYTGQTPGNVLQVGPDGKSLILAPIPASALGPTGPAGSGVGSTGATGPGGPATVSSVGPRLAGFNTPGSYSWTVPSNVNYIIINAVGGGGAGGIGTFSSPGDGSGGPFVEGGQPGQSGGSLRVEAQVTPGGVVTITVGAAATQSGFPGSATSVGGLVAVSGNAGVNQVLCNGGAGGGTYYLDPAVDRSWWNPAARASTTPSGLVSPMLAAYGVGGAGSSNNVALGSPGTTGAVLIEYVNVA